VFMTNSPEMVVAMLAISKIGAISALVNSKLRGEYESVGKSNLEK